MARTPRTPLDAGAAELAVADAVTPVVALAALLVALVVLLIPLFAALFVALLVAFDDEIELAALAAAQAPTPA